ncbi:MAG: outer membrane lipoprotein [bacterium ADurb.Bin400]|nr:MAG: outer membrane lipoprotein [bacterium ADurb.Bin400]
MFCPCCGCNIPNNQCAGMMGGGFGPGWGPGMSGYGQMGYGPTYGPWYTGTYGTTSLPTDEDIRARVESNIDFDPIIPWDTDINIQVDAGEVTLEGVVPSKRIKHAAGDDAWWVDGVVDVHNNIKVQKREQKETKQ